MKPFSVTAFAAFLLALSAMPIANAQTTLPPVNVTANYCDYAANCTFASGFSPFLVPMSPAYPPDVISIGIDDEPLVATCKSLELGARLSNCNVNDPPAAPFFPSPTRGEWVSNGCGSGSWNQKIGQFIGYITVDGFTGNLDEPLSGFSFASACAVHDSCYYSGFKSGCDLRFGGALADVCGPIKACLDIAAKYQEAVLLAGRDAYDADHRDMECSKIAKKLRNGDCAS